METFFDPGVFFDEMLEVSDECRAKVAFWGRKWRLLNWVDDALIRKRFPETTLQAFKGFEGYARAYARNPPRV
jgi:hypothetical protein